GGYACREYWSDAGWAWRVQEQRTQPRYWEDRTWHSPLYPVVGVSWFAAQAYAAWLTTSQRLKIMRSSGKGTFMATSAPAPHTSQGEITFILQGSTVQDAPVLTSVTGALARIEPITTVSLSGARGAAGTETVVVAPHTVVEIRTEKGHKVWTTAARLHELVAPRASRGIASEHTLIGPDTFAHGTARGIVGKIVLHTLRFLRLDVAREAARRIATQWEQHTLQSVADSSAVLYRCLPSPRDDTTGNAPILTPLDAPLPTNQPLLLFLHGTASSTQGSFFELWQKPSEPIRPLFETYKQHIYALEHKTLTASPIHNAIALAQALPAGARLHLVSHSRGGLIGELLCRGSRVDADPFDLTDLTVFARHEGAAARGDLTHLNQLLKDKRIRVERFVRAACPVRGTTLASQRFDIYLSILFNLLSDVSAYVPILGQALDIFSELVMAIAQERTDPTVLPGLEAMLPDAPLVRLLNRPGVQLGGEMRVIAGDIGGGTVGSLFKTLLTDPLYQEDHDLVVNTEAMFGGATRQHGQAFYFERGPTVSHFQYFHNPSTASRLPRTLTRAAGQPDDFTPYTQEHAAEDTQFYARSEEAPRHAVIVLPGFSGSHLASGTHRVWAEPGMLMFSGLASLDIDATGVTPDGLVASSYQNLCQYVSRSFDVFPFPYDWRQSVCSSAALLADLVHQLLDDPRRHGLPVSLLAHGMGGLVARALLADSKVLWDRMSERVKAPLVMLGVPQTGSHATVALLLGRDRLIKHLALLDPSHTPRAVLAILSRFPGLLERLPAEERLFQEATWQHWHEIDDPSGQAWVIPAPQHLEQAQATQLKLAAAWTEDQMARVCAIAGRAEATPVDIQVAQQPDGSSRLLLLATPHGDGRVPWHTAVTPQPPTWYVEAAHGDLADCPAAFPGIVDLLRHGTTALLPQGPVVAREALDRFAMPAEPMPLFPTEHDVLHAGLGRSKQRRQASQGPRATVSIVHGSLAFATYPVMVGHYQGDTFVSAEA
ncbi:MAG: hypothetical protein FJZ47_18870, partial [Candidatus Tectomicrobia bacterium]|nr:hypothetical protein [Candidatus Tectomicrobia bacterium]